MTFLYSLEPLIQVIHYIIAIFMIIVILLQAGKGADIGAAFGAGSSQTLFGARGATTLLSKVTTVVALLFLCTSLTLATISKNRHEGGSIGKSVLETVEAPKDEAPKNEAVQLPANAPAAPSENTESVK